ncbi:TPA: LacI family DNA-binding transcriptional regulator [Staphylococcus pseudintermedius]|uniref:LacI family DNA-binding transcriptional regulator n=1 Tax=Staphylococcus pseudintermedius TaxID=283734 RepID=UPI001032FCE4|nr:LacI family DNA-binding transcriptional regulator [Staphylococcus pseudintermedius]EGQ3440916.1 LacI family transcriptional regulator [Staphylococcus pseudintermedius]EGQ3548710.1 LacI family transcriptional regulator [Staphylococcus pseudintermedius]EGQ4202773.1 LacI family transcriptional regulator [Staphylococcus pseudintermedius]EGQ4344226.1 LacI family transcriptional regulator [Staphylococcus pseudintermedius]EJL9347227.1 LacI family DNA-binding transcriptional regulator [Staphylococc
MNIQDIANLAGVSKSTVSRYLNQGSISLKTKRKIQHVIDTYGYEPNQFAQSLRAQKSMMIGIIFPRMYSHAVSQTVKGIKAKCDAFGYQMLLNLTERHVEQELDALKSFKRSKVDGILFMATTVTDAHMAVIQEIDKPVIIIGQAHASLSSVYHNDYQAGQLMGREIMAQGKQHVIYASIQEDDVAVGEQRFRGLIEVLTANQVTYETLMTSFDYETALQSIKGQLTQQPSVAYVGATDTIALALYQALMHDHMTEPAWIAGFGGDPMTQIVHPTIFTLPYQYEAAGRIAFEQLQLQMEQPDLIQSCQLDVNSKL